ncbi:MAG: LicD family protein [Verrucomicrobia bacterium]|nr:LicD family protein [Verrucomicrobiota bacterium]
MLTAILERNSWIIYKCGLPLVYFYHLLISSVFFNTSAEDAHGLERIGNMLLMPTQYFFEGKKAVPIIDAQGSIQYQLERHFDYDHHFYLKTAIASTMLPVSLAIGAPLKAISYLSDETRERARKIEAIAQSKEVHSNLKLYRSIGLQVNDYRKAQAIAAPKWKRKEIENRLKCDVEALKEIVLLLNKHQIPFWLDCGSCLGCYQYGGFIPNDWDIDIGVLLPDFHNVKNALHELDPEKYMVQDWSSRARPESYLKVFIKETGGMIDFYHFAIDDEKKQLNTYFSNEFNIFSPTDWKTREKRYSTPMPFSNIFPLKRAFYEGIEVPVPGNTEKYLQVFYGENLSPARIYNEVTGNYEKDPTHPYWQLPCAH